MVFEADHDGKRARCPVGPGIHHCCAPLIETLDVSRFEPGATARRARADEGGRVNDEQCAKESQRTCCTFLAYSPGGDYESQAERGQQHQQHDKLRPGGVLLERYGNNQSLTPRVASISNRQVLQRQAVAFDPQPRDDADRRGRGKQVMPERLAAMNIRDMHLDHRSARATQGIG